ncbi:hypothetical protein IKA92_07440 [bacterium]|nr:hypothetical protein [bacterium]MBR2387110.1 hypothetical protein [bacterium]
MLEELKAKLKNLSPEEIAELKAFLNTGNEEAAPAEEAEPVIEKTETVDETAESSENTEEAPAAETTSEELPVEEEAPAEPTEEKSEGEEAIPAEEKSEATEEVTEGEGPTQEETSEEAKEEAPAEETAAEPEAEEDDIPMMKKGVEAPIADDDTVPVSENITAETGEELPVDYEQIVEGLNAKIAALQAENASLKNKYEGAFGFSAKPSVPGKVNPLYDDAIDDIHFHK